MPLTLKNFYKQWWQPWANTLVYYPFDTDINDYSWNNYNLTNYWNVSITEVSWVTSANFINSAPYWLYNSDTNITIQWKYTFLVWMYYVWWWSAYPRVFGWTDNRFMLYRNGAIEPNAANWWWIQSIPNTWELIVFVGNLTTWAWDGYKNWTYIKSWTGTTWARHGIRLWWNEGNASNGTDAFYWAMSKLIFENRQRTAQEIADYFNQTKSLYWIS